MRSLIRPATILANGIFVAVVFVVDPTNHTGTGRAGMVRPSDGPVIERTASLGLVTGWGLQLFSIARPGRARRRRGDVAGGVVAIALIGAGAYLATLARRALGRGWRTSVTGTGDAPLCTAGPYAVIRHPVYSAMIGVLLGNLAVARDRTAAAGAAVAVAGLVLQVRGVEEPALRSAYGDRYRRYSATTGRFIPRPRPVVQHLVRGVTPEGGGTS